MIYPKESIVITYNWTQDGSLTEAIIQVSSLLLLVLPHHEASLTTSQQLKDSFKEERWMSANASIRPEEVVGTKRESTLRFLEFLGQELMGSRSLAQVADFGAIQSLDSILESLAVE